MTLSRDDWNTTWMNVALAMSRRSKCVRRQIGAVIVAPGNSQVWVGYNGPPANWAPAVRGEGTTCEQWCNRAVTNQGTPGYDNCITIHAETNALLKSDAAARQGGTIYVTSFPCWVCAKSVANSGLVHVVTGYNPVADAHRIPENTMLMLKDSGLEVTLWTR